MNETLKNEIAVREYLLGRVSDETLLADYEELLFLDDEFCELAEIAEDALINDFIFGKLNETDAADFTKTLENNRERREKVALTKALKAKANPQTVAEKETTPSFFESLRAFFKQPLNAGAFAVLLIGALVLAFFLLSRPKPDELAELKTIYGKERPTETRISGFDYAPLTITRGEREEREKNKLRIIENELRIAVEKNSSAATHHALGVFLLTQRKFDEAVSELEKAVKLDEKNAKIRNDLGSAYFEKAKTESDKKKLETLAKALENFSRAVESDAQFLPALFNKALCLQELKLYNQAREAWNLYLEKDKDSGWTNEARKNLERLEQLKTTSKTKEQVLEDFLIAYRARDAETAWKINSQTREMISAVWLPDQLSRRFLEAKIRGNDAQTTESIEALKYIGNLEREKNADFFVADLADFYAAANVSKYVEILKAKDFTDQGMQFFLNKQISQGAEKLRAAKVIFDGNRDFPDAQIVAYWLAFYKRDVPKLDESLAEFAVLSAEAEKRRHKFLTARILSTRSEIEYKKNNLSEAISSAKKSLRLAEEIEDVLLIQKNSTNLGDIYQTLGEPNLSANYFSNSIFADSLYFESSLQKLRNLWYSSTMFRDANLPFCAVYFGEEALSFAKMQKNDTALVFDTATDLGISYTALKNFEKSSELAQETLDLAEQFDDDDGKTLARIESHLQAAHIFRLMNECEKSIGYYDAVIGGLKKIEDFQIPLFESHKGRLICYDKLGRQTDFENELQIVAGLFENYRSKITEEESRNSFFDREQNFSNIAADYFLTRNQSAKAFEIVENSKARSLLDLVEGNGFYDAETQEIVFKSTAKPLSLSDIQVRLPSAVQVLQYAVFEKKVVVWLIADNRFETAEVEISVDDLEKKAQAWLAKIKETSPDAKLFAKEIYDILIKPLAAKLDKNKKLGVIPDGILYQMPFAALVSSADEKYLVEDFTIFYAPSLTTAIVLGEKGESKRAAENLLVVGNPDFDRSRNPTLQNLVAAENEATAIAGFYSERSFLKNREAVKNAVVADLKKADIFHFAGHYVVNPGASLRSKLLLAQSAGSTDEFAGELQTFEILQMKNPNLKLAVLSACETTVERFYKGEGAIGMARTFLASGVPLVIAGQWKIESESASELMTDFHRHRKTGKPSSIEALRRAQTAMIKSPNFNQPYFWAAFSAIGGAVDY